MGAHTERITEIARLFASQVTLDKGLIGVRHAPQSAIFGVGHLSEEEIQDLSALSRHVRSALSRLRYVEYAQAESDCVTLADALAERVGQDALRDAHFVGIPRGGLIVLGMLSYVLDLNHLQLDSEPAPDASIVIVDDCALTGWRFHQFMRSYSDREIVFAPLYAHPALRAAIEEQEPNVSACVSAQDLHDHAPEVVDDYEAWKKKWQDRESGRRYWTGQPDHVCFPWNEPDIAVWNPETEQTERGPRVVPPEHCLKNRHELDDEPSIRVQVQPEPAGPIKPHPSVFFGTLEDSTIVANPESDVCVEIDGSAAAMWHALIEHGTAKDTLDALLETYDVDRATLRADLIGFIEQLASNDLLHVPDGALP